MSIVYTIGHSTREAIEFRELLAGFEIECLVDVRQFPGSRRYPQFSQAALTDSLAEVGIQYTHEVDLGGRRRPQPLSHNGYWHNASFRAYADYMSQPPFRTAIDRVIAASKKHRLALMCAETVPWRCHRWLISDALVARGVEVAHILAPGKSTPHALNPHARLSTAGELTYPDPAASAQMMLPLDPP